MPYEQVTGSELGYYLICHDEHGQERDDTIGGVIGHLSDAVVDKLRTGTTTDLFVMCHGWKGDIPAARDQYQRWIRAMLDDDSGYQSMRADAPRFAPLIIGLHWPSLPWGDEELGGAALASFSVSTNAATTPLDYLVDQYAHRLGDTPSARSALRTIFDAALVDIAPAQLPPEVRDAYAVLNNVAQLRDDGVVGAPGADREPFDPECLYQLSRTDVAAYGAPGLFGILSPLRQLSFWKMKDRARHFGETGAQRLLTAIQHVAPTARVHLMGHSFGCIVVSAMLNEHADSPPVTSLVLIQGALSLWSYCPDIPVAPGTPGYFSAVASGRRVQGPIVATQSKHDMALGVFYPLGAGVARQLVYEAGTPPRYAAIGALGIGGMEQAVANMDMLPTRSTYGFRRGGIYNIESSAYIRDGVGASGAHNDIAKPEVAHVVWEAARTR